MSAHGYNDALIAKICNENWLGFVSDSLGQSKPA
jgi:microsomal dipeptidase-like Zn-dependent dipeptidase